MPWISASVLPDAWLRRRRISDAMLDRARTVSLIVCVPGLLRGVQRNSAAVNA